MANKNPVSEYLAEIGRKGGQATGRKGLAAMGETQRKEIAAKGLATRRSNAQKRAGSKKKAA
jgi:general stress protein YciG